VSRELPHSLEAEQSLIGACIIDNEQVSVARELVAVAMFFRKGHALVWGVIEQLDRKNSPVDLTTIVDELRRKEQLDEAGGPAYVASLVDGVPRSTNVPHYAQLVKDYWVRRCFIFAGNNLVAQGYDELDTPVNELIDGMESTLLDLSRAHMPSDGSISAEEWMRLTMQQVNYLAEHRNAITGLATGFKRLDYMTRGLQPGELTVIAARPRMGKTALMLQACRKAADQGVVNAISLEMGKIALGVRAIALESGISLDSLLTGFLDEKSSLLVQAAADAIAASGLRIDETAAISVEQTRSRAKRLSVKEPLVLLAIDYLQLMNMNQQRSETRDLAIGRVTRTLKQTAKELAIPIALLCQLNRASEHSHDKRPTLAHLRESGNIEQDADNVWLIHRPEIYMDDDEKAQNEKPGLAEIILAKQRNGREGTVELFFEATHTKFYSWVDRPEGA
jgi:replicative DNA helicase